MLASISSAVFVHTNGLGSSFQASIQAWMSASSSRTLRWAGRRSLRVGSSAVHQVEPAGAGRREVNMDPGMAQQPVLDRGGFVGGVVVADQVQVQAGGK